MSAYLLSVVGVVLISAVFATVLPEGKTATLVKGVTKLCCLSVILTPILLFFQKDGKNDEKVSLFLSETVIERDEIFINYCSEKRIANAETLLEKAIFEEYGVITDATILWEYVEGGNEIAVTAIEIGANGLTGETLDKLAAFVRENYGCEVVWN